MKDNSPKLLISEIVLDTIVALILLVAVGELLADIWVKKITSETIHKLLLDILMLFWIERKFTRLLWLVGEFKNRNKGG